MHKVLDFYEFQFIYFFLFFLFLLLVFYLRILCQIQGPKDLLMFSFEGFIVLTLLFSFLIYFEFIFVSCERWELDCVLLQMEIC